MKLQIYRTENEKIENFHHVQCFGTQLDLSGVADNQCELILAGDLMDMYPADEAATVIQQVLQKLRIGGEIVLGGTEVRVLAKNILNGTVPEQHASQIIGNVKSLTSIGTLKQALKSLGLHILSTSIDGIHCEVKARRGK